MEFTVYDKLRCLFSRTVHDYVCYTVVFWLLLVVTHLKKEADSFRNAATICKLPNVTMKKSLLMSVILLL